MTGADGCPGPGGAPPGRLSSFRGGSSHLRGFSLLEALLVVSLLMLVLAMGIPGLLRMTARQRLMLGAGELVGVLRTSRAHAIRHSVNVAVKFWVEESGEVSYGLYRDGDGDGVLTRDIQDGVDPAVSPLRWLHHFGGHVRFGFPPGPPPRDPGNPDRRLDNLDDPIRFGSSDMASFNPLGASSPGTLYLTDGMRHLAAVRLFGRTGKVRILTDDPESEVWSE